MAKDYYKLLGAEKNASQDDLKKAFRKLAHQYHPDKTGGDDSKFKEINEAYQVLGDEQKRAKYDQYGSAAFDGSQGGGGGFSGGFDFSGFQNAGGFEDLGEMFGDMFGGGSRRGRQRGGDIQVDVDLSFHDAVFGIEKEVTLTKPFTCERCGGTAAEPGSKMKTCTGCSGKGVKVSATRTMFGTFQTKSTCGDCDGQGEQPEKMCTNCSGSGVKKEKKTFQVSIPSGVDDGATLRIRGAGEAVKGGESGDLFIRLHVKTDARFEREGSTIFSIAKIGFTQAALGATIEVDTVDGLEKLEIPAGTQTGTEFRIRGKGIPNGRSRGDHAVMVELVTPTKLSREQKQMLTELDLKS